MLLLSLAPLPFASSFIHASTFGLEKTKNNPPQSRVGVSFFSLSLSPSPHPLPKGKGGGEKEREERKAAKPHTQNPFWVLFHLSFWLDPNGETPSKGKSLFPTSKEAPVRSFFNHEKSVVSCYRQEQLFSIQNACTTPLSPSLAEGNLGRFHSKRSLHSPPTWGLERSRLPLKPLCDDHDSKSVGPRKKKRSKKRKEDSDNGGCLGGSRRVVFDSFSFPPSSPLPLSLILSFSLSLSFAALNLSFDVGFEGDSHSFRT